MPKVKPRILSRGEIHELKRLQAIHKQRLSKQPHPGVDRPMSFYRPKRLDSVL